MDKDYKNIIKLHRGLNSNLDVEYNENYKHLSRLVDNQNLPKYQPINYQVFKNFIQERRTAANDSLNKVKQLEDANKIKKEQLFNKQHVQIWLKEFKRLDTQARLVESELENFSNLLPLNSVTYFDMNVDNQQDERDFELNMVDQLERFHNKLKRERETAQSGVDLLLSHLKEDIHYYLSQYSAETVKKNTEQNEQVLNMISSVQSQFNALIANMDADSSEMIQELNELAKEINKEESLVKEGIPAEAYELNCPNEELRFSVLQEFHIIDFKYKEKLKQLKERASREIDENGNNKLNGWSQREHDLFVYIYELYHDHAHSGPNFTLRDLMLDQMRRVFSKTSKKLNHFDYIKHEEWCNAHKYFQQQRKLILTEWVEAKNALLVKAEAVFGEAFDLIEQDKIKNEEKEKQLRICNELYEKVSRWRNQKLEALEIQQKIENIMKQQNEERLRLENEKKKKKRDQEKQALAEYHRRIESHKKLQEQDEKRRLESLNNRLREQAAADRDRINYRNKQHLQKKMELEASKSNKMNELESKEKRLQKFYETVKPKVDYDPVRVAKFTQAELNRRGVNTTDGEYQEKKPLFSNYGFSDKQISTDARMRIEQRLRQAGLINNEYARVLMNNVIQTNSQSLNRRNLNSNAFKS